jgi:hypothetical protein
MENEIEKGLVMELNSALRLDKNFTVYYNNIPVGTAKDNLVWFPELSTLPDYTTIKEIVYLGNYKWGVRELTGCMTEFNNLSESKKNDFVYKYLELVSTIKDMTM